ncbi:flavin reductase family protein [Chitinophaga varians]|uniref:flavin reductase family protein n=1 Tax=Chitinophaga varians TaxID=2202339 RepID=UPI00165F9207|nr:flavin reductase family protein [Chitinophaga varians]MBC9911605.1 flavin reductase family protein [Chitinophaga varians]
MHIDSHPAILYFGTPVVLISTVNEDGSYNLAPMSSAFWLGWRCMIGLGSTSQTAQNLLRTRECVLNLPSVAETAAVDRLALTTGTNPVPEKKQQRGYRYVKEKFALAGFTPTTSATVAAPGAAECPVQLEATVVAQHRLAQDDPAQYGRIITFELKIQQVHLDTSILMDDQPDRVDPDKWRPLIMSFQHFYGLGEKVHPSTLAQIPEQLYRPA